MVEIIPKPEKKIPGWQIGLFYLSVLFVILVIFGYFVFASFEKNSEKDLLDLEDKIEQGKTDEVKILEDQVFTYKKKIDTVLPYFEEHVLSSQFFDFLEKNTHPRTFFFELNLEPRLSKVRLSGLTDSFLSLGQQIMMLDEMPQVESLEITNIFLPPIGGIEFDVEVILKTSLFQYLCGNGDLDEGEECDDANNLNGDGCSAQCIKEEG